MSRIEGLLKAYEEFVGQPWASNLSGPEKVWFAVYEPAQERRLRLRIPEFEAATKKAGHGWKHVDISRCFGEWMANHKYREAYFQRPEAIRLALTGLVDHVAGRIQGALTAPDVDEQTVVAVSGVGCLFGLARTSAVVDRVTSAIRGRLLVFFPGRRDRSQYRLFDARDGWSYLAVPIVAKNEE